MFRVAGAWCRVSGAGGTEELDIEDCLDFLLLLLGPLLEGEGRQLSGFGVWGLGLGLYVLGFGE